MSRASYRWLMGLLSQHCCGYSPGQCTLQRAVSCCCQPQRAAAGCPLSYACVLRSLRRVSSLRPNIRLFPVILLLTGCGSHVFVMSADFLLALQFRRQSEAERTTCEGP
ncbi:unnamed protein product [Ostreobium quekettii]|uniref:Uncharacterized protein n=1 Tax=Ostreobium quekettii TaxID=121088 RepID=A0A8S1J953_9CHLO|nr:unnamed protein product [Ostreobium quekettii]